MPNWCEGALRIRGEAEAIVKLCKEYFEGADVGIQGDWLEISTGDWSYIKDSNRAFTKSCDLGWCIPDDKPVVVAIPVAQAWCFDVDYWVKLSKDYGVDIRIHGFEQGMGFETELEVHKGEIITNETITYEDYIWESPMPLLGG